MSVLEHFCLDCGHRSAVHDSRNRAYTGCRCCNGGSVRRETPPRLTVTYRLPGHRAEDLYPPGANRNPGTMHATRTCDCADCHAAYDRLTRRDEAG